MNNIKPKIILCCVAMFFLGCGNNMTIVKARQTSGSGYAVNSNLWQTSYSAGLAHYEKKEYAKALDFYMSALEQAGNDGETRGWTYYSIGLCWEGLKQLSKAQQNYIMAQNLYPNLSEAADGIARIARQRADKN